MDRRNPGSKDGAAWQMADFPSMQLISTSLSSMDEAQRPACRSFFAGIARLDGLIPAYSTASMCWVTAIV